MTAHVVIFTPGPPIVQELAQHVLDMEARFLSCECTADEVRQAWVVFGDALEEYTVEWWRVRIPLFGVLQLQETVDPRHRVKLLVGFLPPMGDTIRSLTVIQRAMTAGVPLFLSGWQSFVSLLILRTI